MRIPVRFVYAEAFRYTLRASETAGNPVSVLCFHSSHIKRAAISFVEGKWQPVNFKVFLIIYTAPSHTGSCGAARLPEHQVFT